MKTLLLLMFLQTSPSYEAVKERGFEEVLSRIYNHTRLLEADQEAEKMARSLLEKYPDDPYTYTIWASIEWLLIGRELNLKADEQKDIRKIRGYENRTKQYRELVNKGLALTENKTDEKSLFLRAALQFDHAKFSARYEGGFGGLDKADKEAAEGLKIAKIILAQKPNFCSAYFFLGGSRLQFSTKVPWYKKPFVWGISRAYKELYNLDGDVINEKKSIEWLERVYHCGFPQPWLKKVWLETNFVLVGAYDNFDKKHSPKEEMDTLLKEVPLLQKLSSLFPQNQDLAQRRSDKEARLQVLQKTILKQKK